MDDLDRDIINHLQEPLPIGPRPFREVAGRLGVSEREVVERLERLLAVGFLTRFGPLYHAEQLGGQFVLASMRLPESDFERVADLVNGCTEVAHNYARAHELNMWFVVAAETPERAEAAMVRIERESGYPVHRMPKLREYGIHLRFRA